MEGGRNHGGANSEMMTLENTRRRKNGGDGRSCRPYYYLDRFLIGFKMEAWTSVIGCEK